MAVIGRPNVGKSTLFNRILGHRSAIVDDIPGVTRDRNYAEASFRGRPFRLVDTGGLDPSAKEGMLALIRHQTQVAIAEADILVVVMDGRTGVTPVDETVVHLLRAVDKPIVYAVNKIDTAKSDPLVADFYRLGLTTLFPISAEHGIGVDDLLEAIYPHLPEAPLDATSHDIPRIAVVGRPNVGKSTLVNALLGQERMVVSDVPGTTRDAIDSLVTYDGRRYLFTDTAGIRRRGRIERGVEGFSIARSLRAMGRSDLAILLLDGVEGITEQDTKIAGLVVRQGRACILLINKWDVREHEAGARQHYERDLHRRFAFLSWAPVAYAAAIRPDSLQALFPLIDRTMAAFADRIPTGRLNQFLQVLLETHPIPVRKGKITKTSRSAFMTQVATRSPVFALFVGHPESITPAYLRFIENRLRAEFPLSGTPIRILIRKK
ncbi:GTPase Der [Nitrospira sp.]|nr:GTPase Der [Nitrospira sp.]